MELVHPFIEGTSEIRCKHTGKPFAELTRFAAVAIAVETVQVDEAACIHGVVFSLSLFLHAHDRYLYQRADDDQSAGDECPFGLTEIEQGCQVDAADHA